MPSTNLFVRRGEKISKPLSPNLLEAKIKKGVVKGTDEVSKDKMTWVRIIDHQKLAKLIPQSSFHTIKPIQPKLTTSPNQDLEKKRQVDLEIQGPRKPKSKKKNIAVILLGFVLFGALYSLPYLTIYQIKAALEEKDTIALKHHVDFDSLRKSFKDQLNASMGSEIIKQTQDNPFVALGLPLLEAMFDKMINLMVTPEAFEAMVRSEPLSKIPGSQSEDTSMPTKETPNSYKEPFAEANMGYKSPSLFTIEGKNHKGQPITFVLTRGGISWRLTDIRLPIDDLKNKPITSKEPNSKTLDVVSKLKKANQRAKKREAEAKRKKAKELAEIKAYIPFVKLKDFKVGKGTRHGFGEPKKAVFGTVVNEGDRTLNEVEVTVYFLDDFSQVVGEEDYHPVLVSEYNFSGDNKPLKPNYVRDFGYLVEDKAPSTWSGEATAKVTNLKFAN